MRNPWIPQDFLHRMTPRQGEFLTFEGREALLGGAAGPGKSVGLLMAALQYVDFPEFSGIILRREMVHFNKGNSIMLRAIEWLKGTAAQWNGTTHTFTFPSGARLEFGHMQSENDKYNYKGAEYNFIGIDEVTEFTGSQIAFILTRIRQPITSRVPMRFRCASNPGGPGHDFIKERFIRDKEGRNPSSPQRQFFPARVRDNVTVRGEPNLDIDDYIRQLKDSGVDPVTLQQILEGDWDAIISGRFRREWFRRYRVDGLLYHFGDALPHALMDGQIIDRFLTVDPAATAAKVSVRKKKDDPDYTVISAWGLTVKERWLLWLGCMRARVDTTAIPRLVAQEYVRWRAGRAYIEGFGIGKGPAQYSAVFDLGEVGGKKGGRMNVIAFTPRGKDKLANAAEAMNMAEAGRIWLPVANSCGHFPSDEVESEVFRFTGDEAQDGHDDIVDTLAKAARVVAARDPRKGKKTPQAQPREVGSGFKMSGYDRKGGGIV